MVFSNKMYKLICVSGVVKLIAIVEYLQYAWPCLSSFKQIMQFSKILEVGITIALILMVRKLKL
jgi:hypothetical protein